MKILIVTPVFWPEAFRVNDLAERLAKLGHAVDVLAGHPNYPEGRFFPGYGWLGPWSEKWRGVDVIRFPQVSRGRGQGWRLALQYASFALLGALRLLARGRWDWDVVFVFQTTPVTVALPALLARILACARAVIWVQDLWPDSLDAVGFRLPAPLMGRLRRFCSWIYRSFDMVLGQSDSFLPKLEAMGVSRERLVCVPQWADESLGTPPEEVLPLWGDGFTLLFAGNLGRAQGLEVILEAAERTKCIPELHWVLLGDGVLRGWLQEEVLRRGLQGRVFLPGRRPPSEMPVHYARADALLVTLGRSEGLACTIPGKLQACMAAGKPILGVVDGEAARVITASGAGWAVPTGNLEMMVEVVRRIVKTSPEWRAQAGEQARAYYLTHFSVAVGLEKILRVLGDHSSPDR